MSSDGGLARFTLPSARLASVLSVALLVGALAACDFSRSDIHVSADASNLPQRESPPPTTKDPRSDASVRAEPEGATNVDNNAMDAAPPFDSGPSTRRRGASPEEAGIKEAGATSMTSMNSARISMKDADMMMIDPVTHREGGALTDAPGANPEASVGLDDEGGEPDVDSGAAADPNPCTNGTYPCAKFMFPVVGDNNLGLTGARVTLGIGGYVFEAQSENGEVSLVLPLGQVLYCHTSADGYWIDETIGTLNSTSQALFPLYSSFFLNYYNNKLGISVDESKGYLLVYFNPTNVAGASVRIDQPSDPPFVADGTGTLVHGNALIAGGDGLVSFPNVTPGPVSVSVDAPPGASCRTTPEGVEYVARPKTTTRLWVTCVPSTSNP